MVEIKENGQTVSPSRKINYYIISAILIAVLLFTYANSLEPQIDSQLDFFELIFVLAFAAPSIFSFIVARNLWGSRVFGRAYLCLAIAFGLGSIGAALFDFYQINGIPNPYPGPPDIFFALFYIFAIIHLWLNTRFGAGGKFSRKQKIILIIIPLGITLIYSLYLLFAPAISLSTDIQENNNVFQLAPIFFGKINVDPNFNPFELLADSEFRNGYLTGIYFVAATTLVFSWSLIGAQVFRRSFHLGVPWALLIVGLGLNAVGDIAYYFTSIYSYDRTNAIIGIWVLGFLIVCYALYLHRKIV
jgi:hypothetical protein